MWRSCAFLFSLASAGLATHFRKADGSSKDFPSMGLPGMPAGAHIPGLPRMLDPAVNYDEMRKTDLITNAVSKDLQSVEADMARTHQQQNLYAEKYREKVEAQQREYKDEMQEIQDRANSLPARIANMSDDEKSKAYDEEMKEEQKMEDKMIKETEEEQKRESKLMPWEIKQEQDSVRILIDSEKLAGIQPTEQQLIDAGLKKRPKKQAGMLIEKKENVTAAQETAPPVLAKKK